MSESSTNDFVRRENAAPSDSGNGGAGPVNPPAVVDTTANVGTRAATVTVSTARRDFAGQFEGASVLELGSNEPPKADAPGDNGSAPPSDQPPGDKPGPFKRILGWVAGLRPWQLLKKKWLLAGMAIAIGVGIPAMGPGGLPGAIDHIQDSAYVQMKDTATAVDAKMQQWLMITPDKPDATVTEAYKNSFKHGVATVGRGVAGWIDAAAEKIGDDGVKAQYRADHDRADRGTTRPAPGTLGAGDPDLPDAHKPEGQVHPHTRAIQDKNFDKVLGDLTGQTAPANQTKSTTATQSGTKAAPAQQGGTKATQAHGTVKRNGLTVTGQAQSNAQVQNSEVSIHNIYDGSAVTGGYDPNKVPRTVPSSAQRRMDQQAQQQAYDNEGRPIVQVLGNHGSTSSHRNNGWIQIRVRDNGGDAVGRRAGRDIVRSTIGKKP